MQKLIDSALGLLDRTLGRRFMPHAPLDQNKAQFQIEEILLFNGVDLIANSGPGASIEPQADGRHLMVITPPQIWAYAAHLMLAEVEFPADAELLVRIDLWVQQGAVGIVIADAGGDTIDQDTRSIADGRTAVTLRVPVGRRPDQLIIRNTSRGAARAMIERVQFYRVIEDPMVEIARAQISSTPSAASAPLQNAFALPSPRRGKTSAEPLVSIIMTVKDSMPYVAEALESIRRQTYRNIEVVVQDSLSTDGTSELLAQFDGAPISIRREKDGGIGDAINRAMARCNGPLVASLDSDNLMEPHTVKRIVEHFIANPDDAVLYGSVRIISADGVDEGVHRPGAFDFLRFVACDQGLPWSTAVFNKAVCGDILWIDPEIKTCVDYNTWLQLSHMKLAFLDEIQGSTRISDNSMSCHPENYEQFCKDKITALRRYADTCAHEPFRESLIRLGLVGVYCWAAESIKGIDAGRIDLIVNYYERAKAVDPGSSRVALAATRLF